MRQANLSCAAETTRRFDMRALMRLAGWGISAAVALLLAVLSGYPRYVAPQSAALAAAAGGARDIPLRPGDREDESRRLAETVRALSADRGGFA